MRVGTTLLVNCWRKSIGWNNKLCSLVVAVRISRRARVASGVAPAALPVSRHCSVSALAALTKSFTHSSNWLAFIMTRNRRRSSNRGWDVFHG